MKYFGTDGIRGVFGDTLNESLIARVGHALAACKLKKIVIGHDTRQSGGTIVSILTRVLNSYEIKVIDVGVVPTTGLAFITKKIKCDIGIMVTASHNPPKHNGIKLFGKDGQKLTGTELENIDMAIDRQTGYIKLWQDYLVNRFKNCFEGKILPRVFLDCANGSGATNALTVLQRLGFEVREFNTENSGVNINIDCGSLHPEFLSTKMVSENEEVSCDGGVDPVGFAFDGDADRCVVFDETGTVVNQDALLAVLSRHLGIKTLVTTVMFNSGAEQWLAENDIEVVRTAVGDRHLLAAIKQNKNVIAGEPSGHFIFPDIFLGCDGLVTTLVVLDMMVKTGKSLSELCSEIPVWHSVLVNVPHDAAVHLASGEFWQDECRVLIRSSGTENLMRIFVEGYSNEKVEQVIEGLHI